MRSPNGSPTADRELPSAPMEALEAAPAAQPVYEFAASREPAAGSAGTETTFRLDPQNRLLTSEGRAIALPGRAFDALEMLVRRPGQLVTKEELMAHIWAGSFVEESNLTVAISTLRRALNEDPQDRRYIQTVARRGYRFIADVHETQDLPRAAVPPASSNAVVTGPPPGRVARVPWLDPYVPRMVREGHVALPLALITVIVLSLSFGLWLLVRSPEPIRSLAILPFRFVSGVDANTEGSEQLLGTTDALNESVARQIIVRPTSSVLRYEIGNGCSDSGAALAAGREQAVDAVLTATIDPVAKPAGVIHLCLLRVRTARRLWSHDLQEIPNDPQATQRDLNAVVAAELHHLGATPPPASIASVAAANGPAYQLYLRGRYFWNRRTVDGLRKSVDYFRQSIAADPNYAPAYAGLADSYALLASFSVEPGAAANVDARSAAFSAIHLDSTLAEPHASLGMIYFFTDWDPHAAEVEFERAIQLNPNYATAHHWYALDLAAMGRFPQALYEIRLAQKLDPLSLIIGTNVGWIEYLARDYAAATRDLKRVLELDPNFARARTRLGMVELAQAGPDAAAADFTRALTPSSDPQATGSDPFVQGLLGDAQARAGHIPSAEATLAALRSRSATQYVPPISRGLVLLGLKRRPEALAEFARSIDDHSTSMVYARVDPALDDLRPDPAFQALLARMKF